MNNHARRKNSRLPCCNGNQKQTQKTRRDKEGKYSLKTSSNPEKFGVDVSVLSPTRQSPIFFPRGDCSGEEEEETGPAEQPSHPHPEEEERPGAPEEERGAGGVGRRENEEKTKTTKR